MKKVQMLCLTVLLFFTVISARNTEEYFKTHCFNCHTIGGGRLTGPDLKNVTTRKERAWLEKFILNPEVILRSGDPYAQKLLKEARGVRMTRAAGITPAMVKDLLQLIEKESGKEKSVFAKSVLKDRPLTPEDIVFGKKLFLGIIPLKNKGPSCLGCHSIAGEGLLGGGKLGPDLTKVFGKLGGKSPLMAWLSNPASTTMAPVYKKYPIDEEEILPLVAFFKSKAESDSSEIKFHDFNYAVIGFLGLIFILLVLDFLWRKRLKAVRSRLVKGEFK